ncbi:MAG: 7-cyano-7-deazaguanine synthase QueC [Armatimonadota bacterium]|jgi:7-cyano-7-deazaguanine synthase
MASVALLSGGLDSAVALAIAAQDEEDDVRLALTFDYGQRAARREVAAARTMCAALDIRHEVLALPWLGRLAPPALVDPAAPLPAVTEDDLGDSDAELEHTAGVWVSNRNGVFVNIAAAYAEHLGADGVVCGFNAEEAQTFPDNSPQFVEATTAVWRFSTRTHVRLRSPTGSLNKQQIVELGRRIAAPIDVIWSCYDGGAEHCYRCESCARLKRALRAAGSWEWFTEARPPLEARHSS